MKHYFSLPYFPDTELALEVSILTGKIRLWKDDDLFERSLDQGKPFYVPSNNGEIYTLYPKSTFPDIIPYFEINGVKHSIAEKLTWYQYVLALLPVLLFFIGGALGGAIGIYSVIQNYCVFRSDDTILIKYLKVMAINVISYLAYLLLSLLIVALFN